MSLGERLLDSLTDGTEEEVLLDGNIIVGSDRFITIPENVKKIAVQYDHDVETVTFDCPRYWDGHDFSTMHIYINYMRADGVLGAHLCSNVVVNEADNNIIHFDWTISGHVTYVNGNISFLVCVKEVEADGGEVTHWNSELNRDLYISEGLECQETVLRRYPDIITQLLIRMDTAEETIRIAEANIAQYKADTTARVEAFEEYVDEALITHEELVDDELEAMAQDMSEYQEALTADNQQFKQNLLDEGIHYHNNFELLQTIDQTDLDKWDSIRGLVRPTSEEVDDETLTNQNEGYLKVAKVESESDMNLADLYSVNGEDEEQKINPTTTIEAVEGLNEALDQKVNVIEFETTKESFEQDVNDILDSIGMTNANLAETNALANTLDTMFTDDGVRTCVKLIYGTYIGTGTYGSSANATSITFPYTPYLVFVSHITDGYYSSNPILYGQTKAHMNQSGTTSYMNGNLTWSGTTVSWYTSQSASYQLNESNTTYQYAAVCLRSRVDVTVSCLNSDGTLQEGCVVDINNSGNYVVTNNETPVAFTCYGQNNIVTVRAPLDYGGAIYEQTVYISDGAQQSITFNVDTTATSVAGDITEAIVGAFSDNVTSIDLYSLGGGGNGIKKIASTTASGAAVYGGSGGGSATALSVSVKSSDAIMFVPGGTSSESACYVNDIPVCKASGGNTGVVVTSNTSNTNMSPTPGSGLIGNILRDGGRPYHLFPSTSGPLIDLNYYENVHDYWGKQGWASFGTITGSCGAYKFGDTYDSTYSIPGGTYIIALKVYYRYSSSSSTVYSVSLNSESSDKHLKRVTGMALSNIYGMINDIQERIGQDATYPGSGGGSVSRLQNYTSREGKGAAGLCAWRVSATEEVAAT